MREGSYKGTAGLGDGYFTYSSSNITLIMSLNVVHKI